MDAAWAAFAAAAAALTAHRRTAWGSSIVGPPGDSLGKSSRFG